MIAVEIKVIGETVESFLPYSLNYGNALRRGRKTSLMANLMINFAYRWNARVTARASSLFCLFLGYLSHRLLVNVYFLVTRYWLGFALPSPVTIFCSSSWINNIFKLCDSWDTSFITRGTSSPKYSRIGNIFNVADSKFILKQLHFFSFIKLTYYQNTCDS